MSRFPWTSSEGNVLPYSGLPMEREFMWRLNQRFRASVIVGALQEMTAWEWVYGTYLEGHGDLVSGLIMRRSVVIIWLNSKAFFIYLLNPP